MMPVIMCRSGPTMSLVLLLWLSCFAVVVRTAPRGKPNILLIMADDLGIGDVGCFGNDTLRTPNIDRIATEGARLTHHLATAALCTPSRAAFMTARYAKRYGMTAIGAMRVNFFTSSTHGMPSNETTIGEMVKEQGYTTGFIGKWHLGLNCETFGDYCKHPLNQGYDYYYGMPVSNFRDFGNNGQTVLGARRPMLNMILLTGLLAGVVLAFMLWKKQFVGRYGVVFIVILSALPGAVIHYLLYYNHTLNGIVMRNFEVVEQPVVLETLTRRLVREGQNFLKARSEDQQPFLLHMSWIQVHSALHAGPPHRGASKHGPYGDEVEELDHSIGEILNTLDELGFYDNTFVYLTSDHGGHNEEKGVHGNREGGWNGIYRGGKAQGGMEGGIRVPAVARYPQHIAAGIDVTFPTSLMDVLPTVANLVGGNVPKDRVIDGEDIGEMLTGESDRTERDFLVHYCGDLVHAARYMPHGDDAVYKAFYATPIWEEGTQGCGFACDCYGPTVQWHSTPLLYNVAIDPSETTKLDTSLPKYRAILGDISDRLAAHRSSLTPCESQFLNSRLLPRFWLQPCCHWPYCHCVEQV